ncbi:MAG: sulfatase-like hydrolase/transferase [Acidimicrobiia bacterium]
MAILEYPDDAPFPGKVGVTSAESMPAWPEPRRAAPGAPNVVVVVLDDVGFAQLGCYGSDIDTPTFDRLAAGGLRYTRFHTTALCSPTRASLLTGRNHHSVGMGTVPEIAMGYPGYNTRIPKAAGMLPEVLRERGYATFAVGKWHLTPAEERHAGATRERWPLGRGFDRYYGFLDGQTDQWSPELVEDNRLLDPPNLSFDDHDDEGYHLTADLADHAIAMVRDLKSSAPTRPFFLYLALGACHSPHHVPRSWSDRYRGQFDAGWDAWRMARYERQKELGLIPEHAELPPRDSDVRAWDDVPADEQRLAARLMEVFAGFLSHADHHVGRVVDFIEQIGQLDDTIVVVLSDNGASAEGGPHGTVNEALLFNGIPESLEQNLAMIDELGGPRTRPNYPTGWTSAGCAPFRRWKTDVYRGGVTDPLIVHWPDGIAARGELRHQWCHVTDLMPTLLDLLEVDAPDEIDGVTQMPIEGVSFASSVPDADAPTEKKVQYFENFGQRAIWAGGWKAIHRHRPMMVGKADALAALDWELYDLERDPTECHDVASELPEVVAKLEELWWVQAERYHVLPLRSNIYLDAERPRVSPARKRYVYWPGAMIPENEVVNVKNRSHRVTAYVTLDAGDEGALVAQGTRFGGWTLFVQDGHLHSVHNYMGRAEYHLASTAPLPTGRPIEVALDFEKSGEHAGTGHLLVDGEAVATGDIAQTVPVRFGVGSGSLRVGDDAGISVTARYEAPFAFTGALEKVVIDVFGPATRDPAKDLTVAYRSQ